MENLSAKKVLCCICKKIQNPNGVIRLKKALQDDSVVEVFNLYIPNIVSYFVIFYVLPTCFDDYL